MNINLNITKEFLASWDNRKLLEGIIHFGDEETVRQIINTLSSITTELEDDLNVRLVEAFDILREDYYKASGLKCDPYTDPDTDTRVRSFRDYFLGERYTSWALDSITTSIDVIDGITALLLDIRRILSIAESRLANLQQ